MRRKIFPFVILSIMANACASVPAPASALPVSTATPVIPTVTHNIPTEETYPTPVYSSTFTPIAPLLSGELPVLTDLHMMDEANGWAVDVFGHVLHTKDRAAAWQDVTPPQGAYNDDGFFALDGATAWATPHCFGSEFGIHMPRSPFCDPVAPPNQTFVWVTHDSGDHWTPSHICVTSSCGELSDSSSGSMFPEFIRFIDADHGWLSISFGSQMNQDRYNIFYTVNGGEEWKFEVSNYKGPYVGALTSIQPLDPQNLIMTGNAIYAPIDPSRDLRYHLSHDGGMTWDDFRFFSPQENPLNDPVWEGIGCGTVNVDILPPPTLSWTQECIFKDESPGDHGFYGYRFVHFHSPDAGETWNYWQQTGDVDFIDAKTGWQLVSSGENSNELQQTHDGGLTWSNIKTVQWDGALNFINEQVGWALAYQDGVIAVVKTADGGRTWEIKTQATLPFIPCTINTWAKCDHY